MKRSLLAAVAAVAVLLSVAHAQEEKGAPPPSGAGGGTEMPAVTDSAGVPPEGGNGGMPDAGAGNISGAHIPAAQDVAYPGNLTVNVDLTDLNRRLLNVHE